MLLIYTVLTGALYPVLVTGIGYVFFRDKINGSLVTIKGSVKGSELIGQKFERPEYFHGRPSAVNYDAGGSSGSNLGASNAKLVIDVKNRVARIRKDFNIPDSSHYPSDFIFASGSGLDPHISIESARLQAERVASIRKIDKSIIDDIIDSNTERQLYIYGNYFVNVLKLNLALADKGEMK